MSEIEIVKEIEAKCIEQNGDQEIEFSYDLNSDSRYVEGLKISGLGISETLWQKLLELKHLSSLGLSSCRSTDWSFLTRFTDLTEISLSNSNITDGSTLEALQHLQCLYLSNLELNDYLFLQGLIELKSLSLSYSSIDNLDILSPLKNLEDLDLSNQKFNDWSPLSGLIHLQKLTLNGTNFHDLSVIREAKKLTHLQSYGTGVDDVSLLSEFVQIKDINLAGNNISDIAVLSQLPELERLWLLDNCIHDLSVFNRFIYPEKLKFLSLGGNGVKDVMFLEKFVNLEILHLQDNSISNIESLANMNKLEEVNLWDNLISSIDAFKSLENLDVLNLQSNPLIELPPWITQLNLSVEWNRLSYKEKTLNLFNNPLVSPPPEIIQQGNTAIDDYFNSIKDKKTVKLNEVKVLLVGEGMAGKTSILKRFQGLDFDSEESQTHGINVDTINVGNIPDIEVDNEMEHCRLHFWDFGGQEIMHASHQFFMSERALYILVLDSRTDSKKYYWLKHIEKLGGNSPILLLMNKADANPNYNIQQKTLNEQFPNLKNRFFKVSCQDGSGFEAVMKCLPKAIHETSLFKTSISIEWMRIKNELELITAENNYLDYDGFLKVCEKYGVIKSSEQNTLLRYLHDLGVVLHFENLNLNNIFVLDPHWVTIGVYKIINSAQINQGVLAVDDLNFILNQEEIKQQEYDPAKEKNIVYSKDEQNYLVNIMELFELCYPLGLGKTQYIVPDLLPKELNVEPELSDDSLLQFVMEYDYLPNPILSRLMLRLKNDIYQGQQWKFGMVLRNDELGCQAKIKSHEDTRRIHIEISGDQYKKQKYFAVIKHALSEINAGFNNLIIKELIPLPGHPEELVDYQEISGLEKMGKQTYPSGKLGKEFSVSEMLDCYSDKAQRNELSQQAEESRRGDINVNVDFNNVGNPNVNQNASVTSKQHAELSATQEQSVTMNIQQVQGLFDNIKTDILEEIEIEVEDEKEKKRLTNELNKVENAFTEMANAQQQGNRELQPSTFQRLTDLVDNLQDKNSKINKAFSLISKGKEKAQKLAASYNKVAAYFGLPNVPDVFL